jgi:hypothetical protein
MISLGFIRSLAMIFAFASLVGGYAIHQYMQFLGSEPLARWSNAISNANLGLGWILLILALALTFAHEKEDK